MYCNYVLYTQNNCFKSCTVQPFLVAVLDFAILVCHRYGHAFCRRLGLSLFWLWTKFILPAQNISQKKNTHKLEMRGKV